VKKLLPNRKNCMAAVALLVFVGAVISQDKIDRAITVGNGEAHSISLGERARGARNPDSREIARLHVEWGNPSIGYWTNTGGPQELGEWRESKTFPDRVLRVRGRLVLHDGMIVRPLGRLQPVRVILARSPSKHPDWSHGHNPKDSTWADCIASADGHFDAEFSLGVLQRTPDTASDFDAALSLGRILDGWFTWYKAASILPSSMSSLRIQGPPQLSTTLEAISRAPSLHGDEFDPVQLICAVNRLQVLGKEGAIRELRTFLAMAPRFHRGVRDAANIDTADLHCTFWIMRVLFEPMEPSVALPAIRFGQMFPIDYATGEQFYPLFPIVVRDDIPFLFMTGFALGGSMMRPESYLGWAERSGRLRRQKLRPANDPLAAADAVLAMPLARRVNDYAVFARPFASRVNEDAFKTMLRRQALRAVSEPLQVQDPDGLDLNEAGWRAYKRLAEKRRIRWSEELQNIHLVIRKKPSDSSGRK
jgi:hypothetical protein